MWQVTKLKMRTLFLGLFVGLMNSCITMNSPHPVISAVSQSSILWGQIVLSVPDIVTSTGSAYALLSASVLYPTAILIHFLLNSMIYPSLGVATGWAYKKYSYPILVTDLKEQGEFKKGRACSESILGLFATGDASIEAAKDNNNIKRVLSVSQDTTSVLGLYAEVCTVVAGN